MKSSLIIKEAMGEKKEEKSCSNSRFEISAVPMK
jgi:hypothetical protein